VRSCDIGFNGIKLNVIGKGKMIFSSSWPTKGGLGYNLVKYLSFGGSLSCLRIPPRRFGMFSFRQ
jgi:hypothetical protein